jgi:hypothetical protein
MVPLAGLLLAACAGKGDISRVQTDALDKSIFINEDGSPRKFYYRQTVTGLPPTSGASFEGMMGDLMKVRFDITEKFLKAYRSYDYAVGSQNPTTGGDNNTDTPVLVYPIKSHFDIKREYNPGTGEETNVISENTTDRPWNQRGYMRVDWSVNQANLPDAVDPFNPFFAAPLNGAATAVGEGDDSLVNPDRPIMRRDYIDFTSKQVRSPDLLACYDLFGADDEVGPWGCGDAEITFRNSLLPVPSSEYEPLSYPDRELIRDKDGTPVRMAYGANDIVACTPAALAKEGLTGDDCTEAALDQFAKFGFFRTALPTYNRQVGSTQEGRQYYANRWNIWQETQQKDADGVTPLRNPDGSTVAIPINLRKTKTITYYLNPEFPADTKLRDMARETVDDWNAAMKETVAGLLLTSASKIPDTSPFASCEPTRSALQAAGNVPAIADLKNCAVAVPNIFVMKENDCNLAHVQDFVSQHPDVRQAVEARDKNHEVDFDNLTMANLLQACTALEVVTENRPDNDANQPKFTWQRNGDLRYSFLHWVDRPQSAGPLGYGPSSQDPETGEIISASAYIYGAALDTYAKFAADSVQLANQQLSIDDLLSGRSISDVLAESATATRAHAADTMTAEAKAMIQARMKAQGATADARLRKVAAGIDDQPIKKVKGTTAEKLLLNDDVLPAIIAGYRPGDAVPDDVFDQAMQKPWLSSQTREQRRQRFQTLAQHGCVYMADFADDAILGTALELGKMHLSNDDLVTELRSRIFRGLADHELGHTMGLRHNFAASTDALNYDDQFWNIKATVQDDTKWESDYKLSEYAYASVMDYGSRFNSDIMGLGKYDKAAIRFGYGQLIDLIVQADESAYTGLRNDIMLYDYNKIPIETGGTKTFDTKATTVMSYRKFVQDWTSQFQQFLQTNNAITVYRERPYKFCEDMFEGNLDCKTWDRGANQQEVVQNVTEMFRNYYAFNAYRRGRTAWGIDGYLNRLQERYFNRYSEAFQFFFFLSDYLNYDLGIDLFLASVDALNSIAAILQTPEPGLHCATATSPTIATFPINNNTGLIDSSLCLANQPKMDIELPDAKPFYINFSDDYYYTFTRVGSLLEKLQALSALTSTESRFFRVDELSDVAARSSINYYRLFRDEVVKLLSGGSVQAPTFQPMPVIDITTFGFVNPPTPTYAQPGAVHIETPVNKSIRYWALLYGLGRLGSSWDFTLDFQNFLAIGVKGADDDFTVAPNAVVEFTHPETGIVYRATTNSAGAAPNIGKQILDEMNAITGVKGTRGTLPLSIGMYTDGSPVPDWYTAKADLDAAAAGSDQDKFNQANSTFNYVNGLLGYDVDLVADIRLFRKILLLP